MHGWVCGGEGWGAKLKMVMQGEVVVGSYIIWSSLVGVGW